MFEDSRSYPFWRSAWDWQNRFATQGKKKNGHLKKKYEDGCLATSLFFLAAVDSIKPPLRKIAHPFYYYWEKSRNTKGLFVVMFREKIAPSWLTPIRLKRRPNLLEETHERQGPKSYTHTRQGRRRSPHIEATTLRREQLAHPSYTIFSETN